MMAMPIISLTCHSTNVKGHNDISLESHSQPVFFPDVTFFDDLYTHLRMRKLQTLPLLHYVIVREAAMRCNYVYYLRVESTEAYGVLVAMERWRSTRPWGAERWLVGLPTCMTAAKVRRRVTATKDKCVKRWAVYPLRIQGSRSHFGPRRNRTIRGWGLSMRCFIK